MSADDETLAERTPNPILADALHYYAERRAMSNPKGWDHVLRVVARGVENGVWPDATEAQRKEAVSIVSGLAFATPAPPAQAVVPVEALVSEMRSWENEKHASQRSLAWRLRRLIAEYEAPAQEAVAVTDEMVERLARSKYERFDSHYSMPGGLSWEAYKADDPEGSQFYVNDATDDLTAALTRPAQVDPCANYCQYAHEVDVTGVLVPCRSHDSWVEHNSRPAGASL